MSISDWHPKGFDAYANSDYDYDDAALLAHLWNIPVDEAKYVIGHKIIHNIEDLLPAEVKPDVVDEHKGDVNDALNAEEKALDAYFNSGYSYEDAELLSQLWGLGSVVEGKKTIGYKILNGIEKFLPDKIKPFDDNTRDVKLLDPNAEALNTFFKSRYTYDDADLLSSLWNVGGAFEAKKLIGYKIAFGQEFTLPDKITGAVG